MTLQTIKQGKTHPLATGRVPQAGNMPALPRPDRHGNVPAVEYARASIAREIIARRLAAGLTQTELARLAGVRLETVNRVENARHTPSTATIARLDAALAKAEATRPQRGRGRAKSV